MIRACGVLLAAAALCPAAGRLELFHAPPGGPEQLVSGIFEMPAAPVGGSSSVRFRIRNVGDGPVTLTTLHCVERWCTLTGAPSLPYIVAAATNVDFTVRFSPPDTGSYSANLRLNSTGIILRATGVASVSLFADGRALQPGDSVDFGSLERGQSRRRELQLRNPSSQPAGIASATISGSTFAFASEPTKNQLAPGAESGFAIEFRPSASGVHRERLILDGREYFLTGSASEPALPRPTVNIDVPATRSGQQGKVSVRLAGPSRSAVTRGVLRMELRPAGVASDNDSAASFINGSRTVEFTIREGDEIVKFDGDEAIVWQSGTTAGTIEFVVEAGGFTSRASVVISPESVRLERAQGSRAGSALDVRITGFDNTRSLETMNFTFYLRNGQPMTGMPVRVPVSAEFRRWWSESRLGGAFTFRASFPVTGDVSQIGSVEVEIPNSTGVTRTERLQF